MAQQVRPHDRDGQQAHHAAQGAHRTAQTLLAGRQEPIRHHRLRRILELGAVSVDAAVGQGEVQAGRQGQERRRGLDRVLPHDADRHGL